MRWDTFYITFLFLLTCWILCQSLFILLQDCIGLHLYTFPALIVPDLMQILDFWITTPTFKITLFKIIRSVRVNDIGTESFTLRRLYWKEGVFNRLQCGSYVISRTFILECFRLTSKWGVYYLSVQHVSHSSLLKQEIKKPFLIRILW